MTIGAFEAKTHLSELLDEAEKGEEITITRHGKPVAKLVKVDTGKREMRDILAGFEALRKRTHPGPTVRELIDEGRK